MKCLMLPESGLNKLLAHFPTQEPKVQTIDLNLTWTGLDWIGDLGIGLGLDNYIVLFTLIPNHL